MEEVESLAQRFASRIEAIRPLQLPRFPGPPPVSHIPKTWPATGTATSPSGSMPQAMGSPMTEASDGQTHLSGFVRNSSSPSGAADELPALRQTRSPQQGTVPDAPSVAVAEVPKSSVPRLDLAAVHSASPVGGATGRLSDAARLWMSQYHDPSQMQDEMVRQQQHLETGRVKIEGQMESVSVMVEDWEEASSPSQTSQPVQNALQV